jgi:hypothetical protein
VPGLTTLTLKQIPVHFSNPDLIFRGGFPLSRFGQGAFQEATKAVYQSVTGHPLYTHTHGKPSLSTYRFAENMLRDLGSDLSSVYMIGDNPVRASLTAKHSVTVGRRVTLRARIRPTNTLRKDVAGRPSFSRQACTIRSTASQRMRLPPSRRTSWPACSGPSHEKASPSS